MLKYVRLCSMANSARLLVALALPAARGFTFQGSNFRRIILRASSDNAFDGYSSKVAFMFPGQGAQYVGMCKDVVQNVPAAAELFKKASSILG